MLDVCCGTGTIGLCMASVAKRVIGIEVNTKAVQDARWACGSGEGGGGGGFKGNGPTEVRVCMWKK